MEDTLSRSGVFVPLAHHRVMTLFFFRLSSMPYDTEQTHQRFDLSRHSVARAFVT